MAWVDDDGIDPSELRAVPCQLVILPTLQKWIQSGILVSEVYGGKIFEQEKSENLDWYCSVHKTSIINMTHHAQNL